ncbi:MAG: carboxypeptidase regulatory-like domain-containing protein [Rhodospirillales bacterium]|jgi:Fe-S-cluster-containing dehydrogenase component|nr:oxidoreductase [Rhodospirillaceae bacterium]MDP6427561.1 carboxypeptidase regulatory-like domain-containing protein [Rhodospirillales bacterium]MDP6643168.1 carboxypeptidase regulatory-like domain-containing protein [Rhodospirillales bacterium]MDP6841532.1 carboxypeptidase regulatory-like domain-containing protein [Rhodospirillales bacterium]|tara:strand:- start:38 stop:877 length:840 start_codon:yes stop_codon:yes gene_type:complete
MSKWNLIVDVANCTNCNVCVLACHDEHVGNAFPGYAEEMPKHGHKWINIKAKERGAAPMIDIAFVPVMCQHCDDAPCMEKAENGAISKRADGIVIIDPQKAKGQKQLIDACPYGAIWWNEEKEVPQHWIFDAHLLDDGWKEPRAVTVCATAALRAVKADDAAFKKTIEAEGLQELHPEHGTKPRVWYKNLYRFSKCFIGGSVETEAGGNVDCVKGAHVALNKDGAKLAETFTDAYGDFKFDKLDPDSGDYTLEIAADGHAAKTVSVSLGESVYAGEIRV